MKKTYIKPNTKSAELDMQSIIALSTIDGDDIASHDDNITLTSDDDGDALSRDITNLWDKEW